MVSGEEKLRVWKPDSGGEKWFCGDCGSSLFALGTEPELRWTPRLEIDECAVLDRVVEIDSKRRERVEIIMGSGSGRVRSDSRPLAPAL